MDIGRRKVCIAVDSSPFADAAVKWATSHVLKPSDELHIITVVKPLPQSTSVTGDPATPWLGPAKSDLEAAEKLLAKYRSDNSFKVSQLKVAKCVADVGCSEGVAMTLCDYAKAQGVNTMVLGSRGLGAVTRPLLSALGLGSVSDYCVRQLPCNVVVHREGGSAHTEL